MFARLRVSLACAVVLATIFVAGTLVPSRARAQFKPIPASEVNQDQVAKARRIAETTMTNWRDGKYEPRSDEFTEKMRKASTPEAQKKAAQGIKKLFGNFKRLKYVEAVASRDMPGLVVYRFRGDFSGTDARPEIRVVMDAQGKVAGFWIKHWKHELQ